MQCLVISDEHREVVVPDFVAEVAEQGAVWLVHFYAQLLAMRVVRLGEIQRDHAVLVSGGDPVCRTGEQIERETGFRVLVAADDRQSEFRQLHDQSALGRFGLGEGLQARGVEVVRAGAGQMAGLAEHRTTGHGCTIGDLHQPIALRDMQVVAQAEPAPVHRAARMSVRLRGGGIGDHQQCAIGEAETQWAGTRQAHGVLEGQLLAAVRTGEIAHAATPLPVRHRPKR